MFTHTLPAASPPAILWALPRARRPTPQARAGRAHLALAVEDPERGAAERGVEVGVGEHDVGRLAAQLERHLLHRVCRGAHDVLAYLGRAGEREFVHHRVLDERFARDAAL